MPKDRICRALRKVEEDLRRLASIKVTVVAAEDVRAAMRMLRDERTNGNGQIADFPLAGRGQSSRRFCELREINLIEDRKCGEFGNGVRVCDGRFCEQE